MEYLKLKLLFVFAILIPTATSLIISSVYAGKKKYKTYSFDSGFLPALVKESPNRFHLTFRTSKYFKVPEFKIEGNLPLKAPTIVKEKEYPGSGQINFDTSGGPLNLHIEPSFGHNSADNIAHSGSDSIMSSLHVDQQLLPPIMQQNPNPPNFDGFSENIAYSGSDNMMSSLHFDQHLPPIMQQNQNVPNFGSVPDIIYGQTKRVKRMTNNWQFQSHAPNDQVFPNPSDISPNNYDNHGSHPYSHFPYQQNQPNFQHNFDDNRANIANHGNSQILNNPSYPPNAYNYNTDHNTQHKYSKVFVPSSPANGEWTPITEGHQNYIPPNAYPANSNNGPNTPYTSEQSYSDNTYESSNTLPRKVNIGEHFTPSDSYQTEQLVDYEESNEPDEGSVSFSISGPHGGEKVPKGYAERFKAQTEYLKKHFPDRLPHGIYYNPQLNRYYNQFTFTDKLKNNHGYDYVKIGPKLSLKDILKDKILSIG